MGASYFQQGVLELSIPYFFRYLEINKELNDGNAIAYAMVNIGAIYLNIQELDNAAEYFEQALEKFEVIYADSDKPSKEKISIYNNLGIVARHRQQSDIAIDYYKRGVSLARRTPGFETELGNLLNNLGNIYLDLEKPKESLEYLMKALQIRLENDDRSGLIRSHLSMAQYHQAQNADEKTLEYLYLALKLGKEVGVLSSMAEAQKMIFETYHKKQMVDSALKYNILYTEYEKKLNQEAAMKELKQLEISSHFRENERLTQLGIKRREFRYMLAGMTLALVTIFLSLLYILAHNRSRRLKLEKENIQLNAKNLELEKVKLQAELEIRNKKLATSGIYQIQNNELINNIVRKLQKHSTSETKNYPPVWVPDIISDLKEAQNQSAWNEFELRFQQVHNDFYEKLNAIYPDLSPNERRLCAFLKLNMTSKEISSITGQSYRSIEVARTRLRKKLNLTNSDIGLIEFISLI